MARVDDAGVKTILATSIDTTPFIQTATLMVDTYLLNAGLSADLLTEIERWLAAHFACIRDPRLRESRADTVSVVTERGQAGTGLQATSYGQQVAMLDPTGNLERGMTTQSTVIKVN